MYKSWNADTKNGYFFLCTYNVQPYIVSALKKYLFWFFPILVSWYQQWKYVLHELIQQHTYTPILTPVIKVMLTTTVVVRVGSSELGLLTIKSGYINTYFRLLIIIFIYNINKKCIYLRDKCLDRFSGTSKWEIRSSVFTPWSDSGRCWISTVHRVLGRRYQYIC